MTMLTKLKIALVVAGSLITGVAMAQPAQNNAPVAADRKAEHQAKKAEMLKKFDANKDGKLDDKEREAARDTMVTERFNALDTDKNGSISLAEFKAGKAQMKMRHARGGRGHMHGRGKGPGGEHGPRGFRGEGQGPTK
jgi:hypothetical protein